MIRAKFRLIEVRQHHYNADVRTLVLQPEYDTNIPEDRRFYDATPSGRLEMLVNNPIALQTLALGRVFYLDLTPAE